MARKNTVTIGTNVTPEQKEYLEHFYSALDLTEAQFVRIAVANYIESLGGQLPISHIRHGGRPKRENDVNSKSDA